MVVFVYQDYPFFNHFSSQAAQGHHLAVRRYITRYMHHKLSDSLRLFTFVTCILMLASNLEAQVVRGQVVDSSTATPVGTGFVVLLDETGTEVSRTLSSSDGRFVLEAPGGGVFRLRSERIGYRASESAPFSITAGATIDYTLSVAALPVRLATLEVQGRNRCRRNPGQGESTVLIWEEIRKALTATTWSDAQELFHYTMYRYTRTLDADRSRVSEEEGTVRSGVFEPPFRSIPAERLAAEGYISEQGDGTWYYIPDAEVLLDPEFLGTHCFHVVRDIENRPGMVGLAFEPMRDRELPDVSGALWLDESTSELHSLEVRHNRVPAGLRDDRVGGDVEFMMLPSGAWIVRKWEVRTPATTLVENAPGRMRRYTPQLDGFRDSGGEILSVSLRDGTNVFEAPLASVTGTVYDSTRGAFLPSAFVSVSGTGFVTTADAEGRYTLEVPLQGEYTVAVSHPWLDSIAVPPQARSVVLVRDSLVELALAIPHVESVLRRVCRGMPRARGVRVLVGVVRSPDSARPVAGATVSAVWQTISESNGRYTVRDIREEVGTDESGFYAVCDVPAARPLTLRAEKDGSTSREASLIFPYELGGNLLLAWDREPGITYSESFVAPERVWKLDLLLGAESDVNETFGGTFLLEGIVVDRETGRPLDETMVILNSGDTTRTREDGTFDLLGAEWQPGMNRVVFRRYRYESVAWSVWIGEEDHRVSLSVTLNPLPVDLEEVEVEGARLAVPQKLVDYYRRRARARGTFVDPEDLARAATRDIIDFLRRLPGINIRHPAGQLVIGMNEYIEFSGATAACRSRQQQPLVYVDGLLFDVEQMKAFQVDDLAAMEVYNGASETPVEFNRSGAECGVLVLWTR